MTLLGIYHAEYSPSFPPSFLVSIMTLSVSLLLYC